MDTAWIPLTGFYYLEEQRHGESENGEALGHNSNNTATVSKRLAISPYYYSFEVAAKGRWLNRTLLSVFGEEFQHHDEAYYHAAVAEGRMWVVRTRPRELDIVAAEEEEKKKRIRSHLRENVNVDDRVDDGDEVGTVDSNPPLHTNFYTMPPPSQWWCGRKPIVITHKAALLGSSVVVREESTTDGGRTEGQHQPPLLLQHGDIVHHLIHKHELTAFASSSSSPPPSLMTTRRGEGDDTATTDGKGYFSHSSHLRSNSSSPLSSPSSNDDDAKLRITDVSLLHSHGLLALHKPSSLPAHPSGRFFRISMTEMLSTCFIPNVKGTWVGTDCGRRRGRGGDGGGLEKSCGVVTEEAVMVGEGRSEREEDGCYSPLPAFPRDDATVEYILRAFCFGDDHGELPPLLAAFPCLFDSYKVLLDHYLSWGPAVTDADKKLFYDFFSPLMKKSSLSSPSQLLFAPCYRLDRATSGIILVSCTHAAASFIGKMLQEKTMHHTGVDTRYKGRNHHQTNNVQPNASEGGAGAGKKNKEPKKTKRERKADKQRAEAERLQENSSSKLDDDEATTEAPAATSALEVSPALENGAVTNELVDGENKENEEKQREQADNVTVVDSEMLGKAYLARCKGNLKACVLRRLSSSSPQHNGGCEDNAPRPPTTIPDVAFLQQHCSVVRFDPSTGSIARVGRNFSINNRGGEDDDAANQERGVLPLSIRCAFPIFAVEASTFSVYDSPAPPTSSTTTSTAAAVGMIEISSVLLGQKRDRDNATHEAGEKEEVAEAVTDAPSLPPPPTTTSTTTSFRAANKSAKDALTIFTPLFYNTADDTTIVLCYPLTGRTHQIRVHLGGMGHPIADDHKYLRHYGHAFPPSPSSSSSPPSSTSPPPHAKTLRGSGLGLENDQHHRHVSLEKVFYDPMVIPATLRRVLEGAKVEGLQTRIDPANRDKGDGGANCGSTCFNDERKRHATPTALSDPLCDECGGKLPVTAFGDEGSTIYLHAYEYTLRLESDGKLRSEGKVFVAPIPSWAHDAVAQLSSGVV